MHTITITIHMLIVDDEPESWDVSDDGGEFDDGHHVTREAAADDASARHDHYVHADPNVRIITQNT